MSIRNKTDIRVYNECPFPVNLVGQRREYIFPACEDGEPTMNFVDFDEIEYAHSRGKLFSIGLLTFNENDREEMYEALGIKDWKNKVWTDEIIKDAIVNPSMEKMQKIIDIKDLITLERVRGKMVSLVNHNEDVSQNVINIINARYREITSGNQTSKIVIRPTDVEKPVTYDEVDELKKQLAQMKNLLEQMAAVNNTAVDKSQSEKPVKADAATEDNKAEDTPAPSKRPGRKPAARK